MLRRFLAIYMALMLVAGPSLCCCTMLYAAPPHAAGQASSPPASPSPCCCKDHCPANGDNTARVTKGGSHQRPEHPPGDHKCPCKDKGTKQTLDQPSSSLTAEEVARLLTSTLQFIPVALTAYTVVDPDLDSGGGSPPPGHRLTSWRLLHAHHMLRC